jgi:hypothetical protein
MLVQLGLVAVFGSEAVRPRFFTLEAIIAVNLLRELVVRE